MRENEAQRITAFQRLADDRLDASYALATAILRNEHDAEDAVHDAVILAWKVGRPSVTARSSVLGSTASS